MQNPEPQKGHLEQPGADRLRREPPGLAQGLGPLGGLWLLSAGLDRLWLWLDNRMPAWDPADYLNGAINYWALLYRPELYGFGVGDRFSAEWWHQFWLMAPKIPPLAYVLTAPVIEGVGPSLDGALLVQLGFSAVLLISVYGLARQLFVGAVGHRVGLWAAAICVLMPGLAHQRLDYLLDYPVSASVCAVFGLMTGWVGARGGWGWLWAIATGLALGLAILVKQTAALFLLLPLMWVLLRALVRRQWLRLPQWGLAVLASALVLRPWVTTNWLLILTSSKRATVDSAIKEGDPSLLSPDAWLFYLRQLPSLVTWPLLAAALLGFLLWVGDRGMARRRSLPKANLEANFEASVSEPPRRRAVTVTWLGVFLIGAYVFTSLNPNKHARYLLPLLPGLSLLLARGLTLYPFRWRWIPSLAVGLSALLLGINLFVPLAIAPPLLAEQASLAPRWQQALQLLSPDGRYPPRLGGSWPHAAIVQTIVQTEPQLQNTLGVLPSTPSVNQHNFSFFGAQQDFRVFGRQVGVRADQVAADLRSLNWFLTKTGYQGSVPAAQATISQAVETSPDFQRQGQWPDPDGGEIQLYHRRQPWLEVEPSRSTDPQMRLLAVEVPPTAPPDQPLAVTYRWQGPLQQLQNTVVALTWEALPEKIPGQVPGQVPGPGTAIAPPRIAATAPATAVRQLPASPAAATGEPVVSRQWFHDHSPGLGFLRAAPGASGLASVQVTERLAMLPTAAPGQYRLRAIALDRSTGEARPLVFPETRLILSTAAPARPAPELDWVTQLRQWAQLMPEGPDRFGPAFEEVARVNQYDPRQDYVAQARTALHYRLTQSPQDPALHYAQGLAAALQQDVPGAIAALEPLTQLEPENPYVHAYLGFVHLYGLQPRAASRAIARALELAPNVEIIRILEGVAALMQGNLVKAISIAQRLLVPA